MAEVVEFIGNVCKFVLPVMQVIAIVCVLYYVAEYFKTQESIAHKNKEMQKETICDGCKWLACKYYSETKEKMLCCCDCKDSFYYCENHPADMDSIMYCSHRVSNGSGAEVKVDDAFDLIIRVCKKCRIPYKSYESADFAINGILVTRKEMKDWCNNEKS